MSVAAFRMRSTSPRLRHRTGLAAFVKPRRVAVGYDIRLSSPKLAAALKACPAWTWAWTCSTLASGVRKGPYFATFSERLDGGIMVTASHNPPDYNGMKFRAGRGAADQCRHQDFRHTPA